MTFEKILIFIGAIAVCGIPLAFWFGDPLGILGYLYLLVAIPLVLILGMTCLYLRIRRSSLGLVARVAVTLIFIGGGALVVLFLGLGALAIYDLVYGF